MGSTHKVTRGQLKKCCLEMFGVFGHAACGLVGLVDMFHISLKAIQPQWGVCESAQRKSMKETHKGSRKQLSSMLHASLFGIAELGFSCLR